MKDLHPPELTSGLEYGGIFSFDENEKKKIDALRLRGRTTSALKREDMVACLVELAYICISPTNNVSQNPGFESCLGIW